MEEFLQGRFHQLITDRSTRVPHDEKRKYNIITYIEGRTQEQLNEEAQDIINLSQDDEALDMSPTPPEGYDDLFYLGRCVQFILDSDKRLGWNDILSMEDIINYAHEMKTEMLCPRAKECQSYELRSRYCSCGWYTIGQNRCCCGNRRCHYEEPDTVDSLDCLYTEGTVEVW
jgi:hypothetical protein